MVNHLPGLLIRLLHSIVLDAMSRFIVDVCIRIVADWVYF